MKKSKRQPSDNEDATTGGSAEPLQNRRPETLGDTDEAFGARQADGLGLAGLYIEADDGRFVSALEFVMDRREAEADAAE